MKVTHHMHVWEPFLEDYLKMGWMFDQGFPVHRGEHWSFLMLWPCSCKVPCLRKRERQ